MSRTSADSQHIRPSKGLRLIKTIRRLLGMARAYRWALIASAILIIFGSLLEAPVAPLSIVLAVFSVNPQDEKFKGVGVSEDKLNQLQSYFTQHLHLHSRESVFFFFVGLMFAVYLVKCLANGFQSYLSQLSAQRVIFVLRGRLHAHLLRLSSSFFESRQTGDLMSRVTSDINMLQGMVGSDMVEAVRVPVMAIGAIGMMVYLNPQLTLVTAAVGPIIAYAITLSSRRMRKITRDMQRRLGQLNAHLQERLAAVRIVQLFTREDHEISQFAEINDGNIRANLRSAKVGSFLYPGIEFAAFIGMTVALLVAGVQILHGHLRVAELFAFLLCAQKAGTGLIKLGKIRLTLDQALAAGERVFEVLDTENEVQEVANPIHLRRLDGRIDCRSVSFRYATGEEVLKSIDLNVAPGEVVALVGPSGAGKTSLVSLIPRFYDPTCGMIEVDGVDIRQVSLYSLRSQIGIVPQETILFSGTIHENIAYGKLDATREEVIRVAKAANADEFICAMPDGYDSQVAERGSRLSGGQRQRIAIARALLKDPRILILDEATSSLDMKSEALVQDALGRLMVGRTAVVIAHRLSTIRNADRILVLSEGRIVEEGDHNTLLAAGGLYSRLYAGIIDPLPAIAEVE